LSRPLVFASGDMPGACENGHYYEPGSWQLSWMTCTCPTARDGGHHVVECRAEGCGVLWFDPRHDPDVKARMWD
jgi:hypothetical protein